MNSMNAIEKNHTENDLNFNRTVIRVGSRKSELAVVQTNHVISELQRFYPDQQFEIHKMTTVGDRVLNISLPKIGEKSLFTKDLEDALKNCSVDFVVHSLKDLPTSLPEGMLIGAILEREDPRDSLVLAKNYDGKSLSSLPKDSVVGTSSLRRKAQIERKYPHLKVHDIRGNLNTRLAKLDAVDSDYAGIVLAQAGLSRLGWHKRINQVMEPNEMLYAVGQGALAVECRASDLKVLEMLQKLVCNQTQCRVLTERSFLKTLGGGCSAPVAVHSSLEKSDHGCDTETNMFELHITGSVWSLDGKTEIKAESSCYLNIDEKSKSVNDSQKSDDDVPAPTLKKMRLSKIIDHSHFTSDDIKNSIICPHSLSTPKSKSTGNRACPLELEIGQDVMGQCPYFDTSDTNQICIKSSHSCDSPSDKDQTVSETTSPDQLFCGIFPHSCWSKRQFEKCELLGKDLAQKLIEKGALSVMESAQNQIRKKD